MFDDEDSIWLKLFFAGFFALGLILILLIFWVLYSLGIWLQNN